MYKYRNGCPSVTCVPQGGKNCYRKLMKGGGPIGEFLYEVGESGDRFADGQTDGG
jgi:hypothetical protein